MGSCVFGCALFGRRPSVSLDRQKSDDRNGSQKVRRFSLIQFHWHCLSKTKRSLFLFVFFLRFLPLLPLRSPSLFVLVFVLRAFSLSTSASNGVAKKKTTPSREPTKTKQKGHVNQKKKKASALAVFGRRLSYRSRIGKRQRFHTTGHCSIILH